MGAQTYLPIEILDYVETHAPSEDSPFGISQRELAKSLGYHPCSMSRPLEQLVEEGLLTTRRGLVREGQRKQLTYRITPDGRNRLRRETKEVPLLSGEIPPPPHPFLGRKDELGQLAEFSREGCPITFLDGPPGMGKTALISRHLRHVKQGRIPFWFTVRSSSSSRQFVSELSHALSFLGAQQLAYYVQLPKAPVAREVADLAGRALGDRTLAAVVDDVQQAGPDMKKFLTEFIQVLARNHEHRFFLVSQEAPIFEPSGIPSRRLTIGGLERAAAHELTDRHGGLSDRFEAVYQSTLGSPLLLQLAVLNPGVEADAATLPRAVVRRLPEEEVRAVLPVALANEPLPLTFVGELGDLPPGRLQELIRTGILHKTLQGRVEVLQVVRTALMTRVGPAEERGAHLQLAVYYSRSHRPESVRERFLHLVEGESWRSAAQLLSRQERVILRLGYSETLRQALRHLATVLPRGQSKVRVLTIEASLLRAHSDYSEAIVAHRRAIADSNDDPRVTCESHLSIVDLYLHLRQVEEGRREYEAARKIGAVSRRLQAYFVLTEARLATATGNNQVALTRYQEAFELARRFNSTDLALESIAAWASLVEPRGGREVALRMIGEALPEARRVGRMDVVFNLLLVRARAYTEVGRYDLAEAEVKQIRSEAEALGYLTQLTYALSGLAATSIEARRYGEGAAYAKQASALAERLGNDLVLGHTLATQCTAEFRQADATGELHFLEEAIGHGERGVEVLNRVPPAESLVLAHAYLAEAYAMKGDPEKTRENYEKGLDLAKRLNLGWLQDRLREEVGPKVEKLTAGQSNGEPTGPLTSTAPSPQVVGE
jgi:tetratricopeptide (TPR) repeat protein/DNA-binding MarR family transcriptional regulator